ncbi:hypothetical protein JXA05_01825 [Candidatus Peregrinibacteria bacterium]|nr:hypothetical protein [Candidatus Peregrinibacteria bacterium]
MRRHEKNTNVPPVITHNDLKEVAKKPEAAALLADMSPRTRYLFYEKFLYSDEKMNIGELRDLCEKAKI